MCRRAMVATTTATTTAKKQQTMTCLYCGGAEEEQYSSSDPDRLHPTTTYVQWRSRSFCQSNWSRLRPTAAQLQPENCDLLLPNCQADARTHSKTCLVFRSIGPSLCLFPHLFSSLKCCALFAKKRQKEIWTRKKATPPNPVCLAVYPFFSVRTN